MFINIKKICVLNSVFIDKENEKPLKTHINKWIGFKL